MSTDRFILVIGNPVDGLGFEGPFASHEVATDYAERNLTVEWWVAGLNTPSEGTPVPKIEVLTIREPDSANEVYLFVDGQETGEWDDVDVDPGAGHQRSSWLGQIVDVMVDERYSPAFRAAAISTYNEHAGSPYVEDDAAGIDYTCMQQLPDDSWCTWQYDPDGTKGDDLEAAAAAVREHRRTAHPTP